VPVAVCSKAVNAGSDHLVRKAVIVARPVAWRLVAGGVSKPVGVIGPATVGGNGGGRNVDGMGNGDERRRRQLTRSRRGRASAQRFRAKITRSGDVTGLAATRYLSSRMNIRAGVFAVWLAAWRYVGCWIGKRVIGNVGDAGVVNK
jgi:hypothetical protein